MKVGVYFRDLAPEVGGGYTYEHDVLAAIAGLRGGSSHEFVAVGRSAEPPAGWDRGAYMSLRKNRVTQVLDRVWHKLELPDRRGGSRLPRSIVDRSFMSSGIDLIWCVSAGAPTRVVPYVTTIWDLQHRLQPIFPEVAARREWLNRERFFSREIGQAAIVIVGTSAGQAEVERFYGIPADRIRRLPHPTPGFALDPPSTDDGAALRRYSLEPGYILYPAQYWAHKNHVGILYALALLRDEHTVTLDAVFVGSDKGNEAHVRQVAASLGLSAQVRFLGFVPRSDLVSLYRNALALAYLTYFGPENLPPLEAFALGCPVIASDVPGAEEQLGDAAILVSPSSPRRIADALLATYSDQDLRLQLVERGLIRARRYTAADFVGGAISIFDELEPLVRTWR